MNNTIVLNDTDTFEGQPTAQSYSHVIADGLEHILVHRINNTTWAAINNQNKLVPVRNFQVLENTAERNGQKMCCPVFCVMSDEDGLQPVMLHDMMRQIFAYGWTCGIALHGDDVWEWDILAQTWLLNGTAMDMAIITPRGDVLLDRPISPPTVSHKQSQQVQRCGDGHWNSCKASTCRHCKTKLLLGPLTTANSSM